MNYGCGLKRGRTSIFFIMENMLFVIDAVLFFLFSCRYQHPLPVDQVKPLNEYEEEGGELISFSFNVSRLDFVAC